MERYIPTATEDPVVRLFDYYFTTSDVIFQEFNRLWIEFDAKGQLSTKKNFKFQRFAQIWLATLFVVAEGFENNKVKEFYQKYSKENLDMRVHWDSIHHMLTQLKRQLKTYRNATFHFQDSMTKLQDKRLGFINPPGRREPIRWAKELHREMDLFFSCYRVEALVGNVLQKSRA